MASAAVGARNSAVLTVQVVDDSSSEPASLPTPTAASPVASTAAPSPAEQLSCGASRAEMADSPRVMATSPVLPAPNSGGGKPPVHAHQQPAACAETVTDTVLRAIDDDSCGNNKRSARCWRRPSFERDGRGDLNPWALRGARGERELLWPRENCCGHIEREIAHTRRERGAPDRRARGWTALTRQRPQARRSASFWQIAPLDQVQRRRIGRAPTYPVGLQVAEPMTRRDDEDLTGRERRKNL